MGDVSRETPPAPSAAQGVFADRLPRAERYADLLVTVGVERGLIGPREHDRIWERHILNSAAFASLPADGVRVGDIGSGAGLPGIPLALARPDLEVVLIEPLLRRATFLQEVVAELGLDRVSVIRARAEEIVGVEDFDVVTSRAVAPLDRLAGWSLPLVVVGGEMLALKGDRAADEVAEHGGVLRPLGGGRPEVVAVGGADGVPETAVVRVVKVAKGKAGSVRSRSPRRT